MVITIKDISTIEIIEKKSRFIATAIPINSEDEAKTHLVNIKKTHYNANHNCYAYQLEDGIQKCSDDKEPSGTAGRPILDVLSGNNITNAIIIVTRYFGGTLLGTGGLVHAYSSAAKQVILEATLIEQISVQLFSIKCNYATLGKLEYLLQSFNIRDKIYTDIVEIIVEVVLSEADNFSNWLVDNTNNKVEILKKDIDIIFQDVSAKN
ncbi:MAG: YigZ family protein [Epulopiscium sp. Nuni2H_MBin003]|nr:MAG: YigZ family protein [Epulopiscium sp. Nuni2H_MBin003]